jgi:hypothetical protein
VFYALNTARANERLFQIFAAPLKCGRSDARVCLPENLCSYTQLDSILALSDRRSAQNSGCQELTLNKGDRVSVLGTRATAWLCSVTGSRSSSRLTVKKFTLSRGTGAY